MNVHSEFWIGSRRVWAAVTQPKSNASASLLPVKSLIYTPLECRVSVGDVLTSGGKPAWILAEHHKSHTHLVFWGLPVTHIVECQTYYNGIDPATKKELPAKPDGLPVSVPACVMAGNRLTENGIAVQRDKYYLGTPVVSSSKLDNRSIHTVKHIAGIYECEVN